MKKFFKTFLKMKYNRSSSFIYKKEFCRLYRNRATAPKEHHSKRKSPERTASQEPKTKKEDKTPKKERNKKERRSNRKYKASTF
mgnify:CR=1 FL=1